MMQAGEEILKDLSFYPLNCPITKQDFVHVAFVDSFIVYLWTKTSEKWSCVSTIYYNQLAWGVNLLGVNMTLF